MTTPQITNEAVEAGAKALWTDYGFSPAYWPSDGVAYARRAHQFREDARTALVAAEPYLRAAIAEEIARTIEATKLLELHPEVWTVTDRAKDECAAIAREVGTKANGEPS